MKLSCFADEISPDIEIQLRVMHRLGLRYMDFRSVDDVSVLELPEERLNALRRRLDSDGVRVACIGSAVGKIPFSDGLQPALAQLDKAICAAKIFGTRFVRVFSFFCDPLEADANLAEAADRMLAMAERAAKEDIVLVSENECDVLTDTSQRCQTLMRRTDHPNLRAVFDPSNFRGVGERPYDESLPRMLPYIACLHIKDSRNGTDEKVVAGEGDAQIPEVLGALADRKDLTLTLEPHLTVVGRFRGFSGEEAFGRAHRALTDMLKRLRIDYD